MISSGSAAKLAMSSLEYAAIWRQVSRCEYPLYMFRFVLFSILGLSSTPELQPEPRRQWRAIRLSLSRLDPRRAITSAIGTCMWI